PALLCLPVRPCAVCGLSALDDVDGESAARRLLVLRLHIGSSLPHGLDRLIETHPVAAIAVHRQPRGVDRLDRGDRIAFDARHLDEPADRIAGEPEVVFEADLGGVLDLFGAAAQDRAESRRGHRAGGADLPLTADLGPEIEALRLNRIPIAPAVSRKSTTASSLARPASTDSPSSGAPPSPASAPPSLSPRRSSPTTKRSI